MHRSNIFQIPNHGWFQCASRKLLWLGLLFDGGPRCRLWGRFRGVRGSNWVVQIEAPATKQEGTWKKTNMSMMTVMIIRTGLRGVTSRVYSHVSDLLYKSFNWSDHPSYPHLSETKQRGQRTWSRLVCGIVKGFFKRVSGVVTLLTCCFLYKRGMEKTAITAVQQ